MPNLMFWKKKPLRQFPDGELRFGKHFVAEYAYEDNPSEGPWTIYRIADIERADCIPYFYTAHEMAAVHIMDALDAIVEARQYQRKAILSVEAPQDLPTPVAS